MISEELLRVLGPTLLIRPAEQHLDPCSGVLAAHYLILCSALSVGSTSPTRLATLHLTNSWPSRPGE